MHYFFIALTVLISPSCAFAQLQSDSSDAKYALEPRLTQPSNRQSNDPLHTDQQAEQPKRPLFRMAQDYDALLKSLLATTLLGVPKSSSEQMNSACAPTRIIFEYLQEFTLSAFIMPSKKYDSLALSKNGKTLAIGNSSTGEVTIQALDRAHEPQAAPLKLEVYKCLAVSDDGSLIVFLTKKYSEVTLKVCAGANVQSIDHWHECSRRIYRARILGGDRQCIFEKIEWHTPTSRKQNVFRFDIHTRFITNLYENRGKESSTFFEKDGRTIEITGDSHLEVQISNREKFTLPGSRLNLFTWQCPGLAITPDEKSVIARYDTGTIAIWDLEKRTATHRVGFLNPDQDWCLLSNDLELSGDGLLLAIRTNAFARPPKIYRTLELLNVQTLKTQQLISTPEDIDSMAFSEDAQTLAVTLEDGTICAYTLSACPDDAPEKELMAKINEQQEIAKGKQAKKDKEREEFLIKKHQDEALLSQRVLSESQNYEQKRNLDQVLPPTSKQQNEQVPRKTPCCKTLSTCTIL